MTPADTDEHGRPHPPCDASEADMLVGYLDYQRATLVWKCVGLDAAALRATTAASTMTLGGLMKHMAFVEDYWFTKRFLDNTMPSPWARERFEEDEDWDWHSAADDSPEEIHALWTASARRARLIVSEALADGRGLDSVAAFPFDGQLGPTLRWIMLHMLEEYARHNGHADILREAIDGSVGD